MFFLKEGNSLESARKNPISTKNFASLRRSLLQIARDNCPRDTSNMAENAIYSTSSIEGFKIVWDNSFAFYLPYVDKGINPLYPNSPNVKANKGFVDRSIAYMQAYTSLFLYGQTKTIGERFNNQSLQNFYDYYNKVGKNTGKTTKVRNAPLFVELAYRQLYNLEGMELVKDKGAMMANLIKSLKKEVTTKQRTNEILDFMEQYKNFNSYD